MDSTDLLIKAEKSAQLCLANIQDQTCVSFLRGWNDLKTAGKELRALHKKIHSIETKKSMDVYKTYLSSVEEQKLTSGLKAYQIPKSAMVAAAAKAAKMECIDLGLADRPAFEDLLGVASKKELAN